MTATLDDIEGGNDPQLLKTQMHGRYEPKK